jgi:hypothetical protein
MKFLALIKMKETELRGNKMSSVGSCQTASELPPVLGNFIDACAANKLVAHAHACEYPIKYEWYSMGVPDGIGYINRLLPVDETTGRTLSESELKSIKEEESKKLDAYRKIKNELPSYFQAIVSDLASKLDTVKKIARHISVEVDTTLYEAIRHQWLDPLDAITNCSSYIDHLAMKTETYGAIKLTMHSLVRKEGDEPQRKREDFFITSENLVEAAPAIDEYYSRVVIHVQPGTEFYLLCGRRIQHITLKGPNPDGTKTVLEPDKPCIWFGKFDEEHFGPLKAQFDTGLVTRNTFVVLPHADFFQMPTPLKISSFIKPYKFWEEHAFEQAQQFFGCRIEGSEESILPALLVNTILKDYMIAF